MRAVLWLKTQHLISVFPKYSKATCAALSVRRGCKRAKMCSAGRAATEAKPRLGCILPLAKCTQGWWTLLANPQSFCFKGCRLCTIRSWRISNIDCPQFLKVHKRAQV